MPQSPADLAIAHMGNKNREGFASVVNSADLSAPQTVRQMLADFTQGDRGGYCKTYLTAQPRAQIKDHLGMLGLAEVHSPFYPNVSWAVFESPQFIKFIREDDSLVTRALGVIAMRDKEPKSAGALKACIDTAALHSPHKQHIAFQAFKDSFLNADIDQTKMNCFTCGSGENFATLVSYFTPEETAKALSTIVQYGISRAEKRDIEPMLKKFDALIAKLPDADVAQIISRHLGNMPPALVQHMQHKLGKAIDPVELLMASCEKSIGVSSKNWSANNLRDLLTLGGFDEAEVFTAMITAIGAGKAEHLKELCDYAREQGFKDLVNQQTGDGHTLLTLALGKGLSSLKMVDVLVGAGANNDTDRHGNTPISLMDKHRMTGGTSYQALSKVLSETIEVAFAGKKAAAEVRGRLGMIREAMEELIKLGFDENQARSMAAQAAGMQVPPSLPAIGTHTASEQQRRLAAPNDNNPESPGGNTAKAR